VPVPAGWPAFSVSPAGALAYVVNPPGSRNEYTNRMQWVDRSGQLLRSVGAIGGYWSARLSHDGRRVAVQADETWLYDAEKGIPTRFAKWGTSSVWSPSDDRLVGVSWTSNVVGKIEERPLGDGEARTVAQLETNHWPSDWSPDGRWLALTHRWASLPDLVMLDLSEHRMVPFLTTDYNEMNAVFSPDGGYVAYQSDDTGAFEIYLRPFPGPGPARRISLAGGQHPRWRADGKELFFLTADWTIMATPIRTQPSLEVGTPAPLFRMPMADIILGLVSPYDVAPDGKRFLVIVPQATAIPLTLTFVQNWTALLEK
jgi:dipeptidyl aminopeptidase/acylaminoacyl peptidase